tara:strand:- start:830 stop:1315 length:486 start_codon:yes stop_codon:yes gene_type:complete
MKKVILVFGIVATALSSFAQVKIQKSVDEMTDKVSYFASERFFAANSTLTKGCAIDMVIDEKSGVTTSDFMAAKMVGLESCNENNSLIFLFENGEKFTLKSWNKFNCKGNAYFTLSKANIEMLKVNSISKVRITNGKSYKSYTAEITYKNYFIEFYSQLNK